MKNHWKPFFGAFTCVALAITGATAFLPKQSLWIDETSQLGGIEMGPRQVTAWLAGKTSVMDVPADRTPPLSYWCQQAWTAIFGHDIHALRAMGVCCIGLSAAFIFLAARRANGDAAGWAAGLIFALSPNVANIAVEIRAYPLFLLISATMVWAVMQERTSLQSRWLVGIAALGAMAGYVHFFGVIMASAMLGGIFLARWKTKQPLRPVLLTGAAEIISWVGLYPFIQAARNLTGPTTTPSPPVHIARSIIRLLYRLIGHPAMTVQRWALVASIVGCLILIVLAFWKRINLALLAALLIGLFVVIGAGLVVRTFDTTAPHYNIWLLPIVCVILGAGASVKPCWGMTALALVILGETVGIANLATHGENFAHAPFSRLAKDIDQLKLKKVTIVIDGPDSSQCAAVYLPMRWLLGRPIREWVWTGGKVSPRIREVHDVKNDFGQPMNDIDLGDWVIVIQTRDVMADELTRRIRSGDDSPLLDEGPIEKSMETGWRQVESRDYMALMAARVRIFRKT